MKKILTGLILATSCATASATTYNITTVLDGSDGGFGYSGFHDARGSNPMSGLELTGFGATPVSGTYSDSGINAGKFDLVLNLTDVAGTVTLSGTNVFFGPVLNNDAMITATFSNPTGLLQNTTIVFDNSIVCCASANPAPNSFDGSLMSLWGANFPIINGVTSASVGPTIGLDLRIELQPVPVPAAVWLFGSGLLGLVGIARRKRA